MQKRNPCYDLSGMQWLNPATCSPNIEGWTYWHTPTHFHRDSSYFWMISIANISVDSNSGMTIPNIPHVYSWYIWTRRVFLLKKGWKYVKHGSDRHRVMDSRLEIWRYWPGKKTPIAEGESSQQGLRVSVKLKQQQSIYLSIYLSFFLSMYIYIYVYIYI